MKIPFNLYTNKHTKGKYLPKCPIIKNTPEVVKWINDNYKANIDDHPTFWDESKEYIMFGISASYVGNIYFYLSCYTEEEINRYNESCIKHFDYNFEGFKKYLNWALKLPKFIVNGKFDKE